jgi:hypothetical protein
VTWRLETEGSDEQGRGGAGLSSFGVWIGLWGSIAPRFSLLLPLSLVHAVAHVPSPVVLEDCGSGGVTRVGEERGCGDEGEDVECH